MITVVCDNKVRNEVWDFMLTELSKMYLHSMALLYGRDSTYKKKDYELIDRAKDVIRDVLKVKNTKKGFCIDSLYSSLCFSLARELLNDNSYHDGYSSDEQSSIKFALQNVVDKFPGIKIQGYFEDDGGCMFFVYRISTKNSLILVEEVDDEDYDGNIEIDDEDDEDEEIDDDEGDDNSGIEDKTAKTEYDEKAFLEYALKKHPYKAFMDAFMVHNEFSEKMYKEFLISCFLYKDILFCREGYTYEGFKMYIWLCIFEDHCVGISEDEYKDLFEGMLKDFNDNSRFVLLT